MPESGKQPGSSQQYETPHKSDGAPGRGLAARIINAITFISIVFFLGLWIAAFLILKDGPLASSYTGNLLTNLTCLSFFGGMVIAIFIGAMAGNLLRRLIWKSSIRRGK